MKNTRRAGRSGSLGEKVLEKVMEEVGTESMPVQGKLAGRKRACEESEDGEEGGEEDNGDVGEGEQYEEGKSLALFGSR